MMRNGITCSSLCAGFLILTCSLLLSREISGTDAFSSQSWKAWTDAAKESMRKIKEVVQKLPIERVKRSAKNTLARAKDSVFGESCNSRWVTGNVADLKGDLERSLCGQPLARNIIINGFDKSYRGAEDEKRGPPLAFHFSGGSGTGKTFTVQMIISNLYREGERSGYVHIFSPTTHYPDRSMDHVYIARLKTRLTRLVNRCKYQLFVFDDFDKMGFLVSEVVSPILSTSGMVYGADFSRSVFLFVGTSQQPIIEHVCLTKYNAGVSRDSLVPSDFNFEQHCYTAAMDSCQSNAVTHHATNVPFLPLNRSHVECCIRSLAKARTCDLSNHIDLTDQVKFTLKNVATGQVEYADSGCKQLEIQLATLCP